MTFKQIRTECVARGLVFAKCRELSPYYYSRNGSVKRERSAGSVAWAIRDAAEAAGIDVSSFTFPRANWSGKWKRTVSSLDAEGRGDENFWKLFELLREKDPSWVTTV